MGKAETLVLALSCLVVPMQALRPMGPALLRDLVMEEPACPDQEAGLALWSDPASWGGVLPASGDVVTIDKAMKLDVPKVDVKLINIVGNGTLVFSDTIDINLETEGIMVQDSASLILGSNICRFQHDVHILFKGIRTADRSKLGDKGEKYMVVKDKAILQLHGKKVLPWTKLSETVERFDAFYGDRDMIVYSHKMSEYAKKGTFAQGPALYVFSQDFKAKFYKVYDFDKGGSEADEQKQVDNMLKDLKSVQDGDIVAIAKQKCYETKATLTELNKKLIELTGVADVEQIATLKKCDAYSLVFQKGGEKDLKIDRKIGKNIQDAVATIISNSRKVTAVSHVDDSIVGGSSKVDFRILSLELGYPIINVVHDLTTSSWKVGDELLLTSTDYDMNHAEVRTIKEIILPHTIRLSGEMEYRHFGKIEDNIDMRGEVAHLNRNIKFEGEVQDYCPDSNSNCGNTKGLYNFDTYGAHIKILHGFGGVFFQGVELTRFGQLQDKGQYPFHFHVCGFVGDKEAIVRNNVIKHSFARAVVVHGTYGTSLESPGVIVEDNVAFGIYGMAFYVEDGAERGTILRGNLGTGVKMANNGFTEDLLKPSVFWWTTPEVSVTNNVAAGSEGRGFWMSLPKAVVGPSAALGVYAENEALHTPIWPIDNNVAHSNWKGGFHIRGLLLDENGTTTHEMNYAPRENPLDSRSPGVKVQVVRLTVYKNLKSNLWAEAGAFEVMQLSSAESQIGVQINRAELYSQFLKKSVIVGRSKENYEEEGKYPDAGKIKRYIGWLIWGGPTLVKQAWFDGFGKDPKGKFIGGAIGYVPFTPYPSSALCNFTELRFGYEDKVNSKAGNRVFLGNIDDKKYGYSKYMDGDESETFIDGDGSLTKCPQDENWDHPLAIVRPEKFAITENCQKRENWKMFVCDEKLGKIRVYVIKDFHGANKNKFNDATQAIRRNRKDETDVAYEDHTGEKATDYVVVLKSDKYYYAVQWLLDFPKKSLLRGFGVEQNYSVVVGLCLPENIGYSDIAIFARREGRYNTNNDDFIHATSIDEVFNDVTMSTVFLENRILYMNIINERTRKAPWTSLLVDECPGNRWKCSYFTVDLLVDDIQGYKPCFNPTKQELSTDNELGNPAYKSMECDLPAGPPPEKDWGAGDFYKTAVDGQWSDWFDWSPCCPATTQTRRRYCDNPPPFRDGLYCVGPDTETRNCVEPC